MSLLVPAMLAGAAGLAVPVLLHLIARHKFPVQDFPTIRLLRYEKRSNVFAWRLVDVSQLLLRLLVLALLALAMSRLFAGWASPGPAPRNLVVVIDSSASMRMETKDPDGAGGGKVSLLDLARRRAGDLLREIEPPSRCALMAAAEAPELLAPLAPSPDGALAALEKVEAGDGTGAGLVRAVAQCCEMVRGRREVRSQIVVLTDLRATAFETRNQWDLRCIERAREEMGERLDIAFVDVGGGTGGNLAIVDARLRGGEVRVGDDAHVVARVINSGTEEKPAALRLAVGGAQDPNPRTVALAAGGEAVVDLTSRINRAASTFGEVRLQEDDALAHDDRFVAPVDVADVRRVLIVRGAEEKAPGDGARLSRLGTDGKKDDAAREAAEDTIDGATILKYVLNPGREMGLACSSGIDATAVTAEALATQPLSKYDVVCLYDASGLPDKVLNDLDTFVRQGKALLLFCSGSCNPMRFNRSLGAGGKDRAPLSPALIGNDRAFSPPVGIDPDAARHPILAPFRDRLQGDLSVVRFSALREIRNLADGARVLVRAADGTPLIVEREAEHGRVLLATFGLELDRGNIARARVFPAMMWRLTDYVTGRMEPRAPDILPAGAPRVLSVHEPAFAFETSLDLTRIEGGASGQDKEIRRVPIAQLAVTPEKQVLVPGLPAGRYLLHKPQRVAGGVQVLSYARHIAVNPDPRESRTERLDEAGLRSLFGAGTRTLPPERLGEIAPRGGELWTALVVLLLLAYAGEAAAGWIAGVRSERERSAGGPA